MVEAAYGARDEPRHPRPWLAASLSFLFPGLGQAYAGQRVLAAIFALPVVVLIVVVIALQNGFGGPMRNSLLSSGFLAAVIIGNVLLLCWRTAAIVHAALRPPISDRHERRIALTSVAILVVLTIAMHAWVGIVVAHLDDTLSQVFGGTLVPNEPLPEPSGSEEPVNAPEYRWDGTDRINVLLLGTDAHVTREQVLTDVILVVSVDPVAGTAEMISVPRDTGFVPLPDESVFSGALYPEKVNGLSTVASLDPETWCPDLIYDADACGLRTIERSIGLYLGIDIHHYALVDMAGFAELIDAVGGLRLCLPGELTDPEFDGSLDNLDVDEALVLPAGCHEYNGIDALAYARSRQGWIELPDGTREPQTDFSRNERQQAVLLALRDEMAQADLIFELPAVLRAVGRTVSTDFPRDQAGDLASLLPLIAGRDIERVVLGYPDFVDLPAEPEVNYLLVPKRDAIREEMARLFGDDELSGWYLDGAEPQPIGTPGAPP
ncbi:MAG TPA: LCP family protein [Candidatus Limnocylindrales bacterium]|nr:LCP family protein [Candidatus Limnocylindrales bacterium]